MNIKPLGSVYGPVPSTKTCEVKREHYAPCVDGVEVKLNRLTHDVHERIVVGYDLHGRAVYGTLTPTRAFDIRDSKEDPTNVGTP